MFVNQSIFMLYVFQYLCLFLADAAVSNAKEVSASTVQGPVEDQTRAERLWAEMKGYFICQMRVKVLAWNF